MGTIRTDIKSSFYIERYKGNGILQLQDNDYYFPLDMGNGNYVAVSVASIDRGKTLAAPIIKSFQYIFTSKSKSNYRELYEIFNKTYVNLQSTYHFLSRDHAIVSIRVVLFYLLGLEKNGSEINLRRYQNLSDFIRTNAYPENVTESEYSIVDLLLTERQGAGLLEFYSEKRHDLLRAIKREQALATNVILPMAELLRLSLVEGLQFVLGLELASLLFRIFNLLARVYKVVTRFKVIKTFEWLIRHLETMSRIIKNGMVIIMEVVSAIDFVSQVREFIKLINQVVDGILDIFIFQNYVIDQNILFFDGLEEFEDEHDQILFETIQDFA